MNDAAFIVYIGVFLVLPPVLLMTRLLDKARMPWVLLLAVSMIVGWLLVNLAHVFYVNGLLMQMSATGEGMPRSHGYATNDILFAFGWLLGPAYLVPWLFLYCCYLFVRWMLAGRGGQVMRR